MVSKQQLMALKDIRELYSEIDKLTNEEISEKVGDIMCVLAMDDKGNTLENHIKE